MKKKIIILFFLALVFIPLIFLGVNKIGPVSWIFWGDVNNSNGVAIRGYDPVAYFELKKAVIGDEAISYKWNNVEWHFDSQEHLKLFKAEPNKYAPQFGGYCAAAISIGLTADTNPESWHIENEKLYLFFNDDPKQDYIAGINDGIIQKSEQKWENR